MCIYVLYIYVDVGISICGYTHVYCNVHIYKMHIYVSVGLYVHVHV